MMNSEYQQLITQRQNRIKRQKKRQNRCGNNSGDAQKINKPLASAGIDETLYWLVDKVVHNAFIYISILCLWIYMLAPMRDDSQSTISFELYDLPWMILGVYVAWQLISHKWRK